VQVLSLVVFVSVCNLQLSQHPVDASDIGTWQSKGSKRFVNQFRESELNNGLPFGTRRSACTRSTSELSVGRIDRPHPKWSARRNELHTGSHDSYRARKLLDAEAASDLGGAAAVTIVSTAEDLQTAIKSGNRHIELQQHVDISGLLPLFASGFAYLLGAVQPTTVSIRVRRASFRINLRYFCTTSSSLARDCRKVRLPIGDLAWEQIQSQRIALTFVNELTVPPYFLAQRWLII
jgi:hypothetical protein